MDKNQSIQNISVCTERVNIFSVQYL